MRHLHGSRMRRSLCDIHLRTTCSTWRSTGPTLLREAPQTDIVTTFAKTYKAIRLQGYDQTSSTLRIIRPRPKFPKRPKSLLFYCPSFLGVHFCGGTRAGRSSFVESTWQPRPHMCTWLLSEASASCNFQILWIVLFKSDSSDK
jgi:hypothetical protein